jgi:hypothetical protein
MAYNAYITTLKNVRKHPNADRLQLAECFGNTVCVNLDYSEGEVGVYFPTDGQLSEEFATVNNLVRKKDDAGNNIGGYMDPSKRNVQAIRLRGEKSDGLFLPLSCLVYTGVNLDDLKIGDPITVVNGHEICQKYIPRRNPSRSSERAGNKTRKKKVAISPLFAEHADTEQLAYNLGAFKVGDQIEITLKMHGTSQRTGYLPVFKKYKRTLLDRIFRREGTPIYDWGYVSGTRRTVLEDYSGGYYGSNEFREEHSKTFEGKLWKGETVYYEIVGYTKDGGTIMGKANNKKLNDKEFIKQYGNETTFSYGCVPNPGAVHHDHMEDEKQSDMYVYRMTMTNEDGQVIEYTPDFMRYRCEMMGIKTVPLFTQFHLDPGLLEFETRTPGEIVKNCAECYYAGPDPIGKTHVREGVVVRIVNRPKFTAYKHKNFEFKVLEGIIKDAAEAPDMEEAESVQETI